MAYRSVWRSVVRGVNLCSSSRVVRTASKWAFGIVLAHAAVVASLVAFQLKILYIPRSYSPSNVAVLVKYERELGLKRLQYKTTQGDQVSFFLPSTARVGLRDDDLHTQRELQMQRNQLRQKRGANNAELLYVVMSGNAGLALDWVDWLNEFGYYEAAERGVTSTSFLLVDYPGYGFNDGAPSPDTVAESVEEAIKALSDELGLQSVRALGGRFRIGLLGHSLGCAGLLHWATHRSDLGDSDDIVDSLCIDRAVLISPFTCVADFGRRFLFNLPSRELTALLVRHKYDNIRAAEALVRRATSLLHVHVTHGDRDNIVPFAMGKELHSIISDAATMRADGRVTSAFHAMNNCDHNDILHVGRSVLFAQMISP